MNILVQSQLHRFVYRTPQNIHGCCVGYKWNPDIDNCVGMNYAFLSFNTNQQNNLITQQNNNLFLKINISQICRVQIVLYAKHNGAVGKTIKCPDKYVFAKTKTFSQHTIVLAQFYSTYRCANTTLHNVSSQHVIALTKS